jgi:phosphatidylserine decarboxylase
MAWSSARRRLKAQLVRILPKAAYGKMVGFCARRQIPPRLRTRLYTQFARRYGVDLSEVERPLGDYTSFDDFFTRRLRPGLRPVDPDPGIAISPVDGAVVASGIAWGGRLVQAKGLDYQLAELLVDPELARRFDGGAYATLYLAPRDYHRIHSPYQGVVTGYRHIAGTLFPVNAPSVESTPRLFARNERLVTLLETSLGPVAVVKVAATGVSDITVSYDPDVRPRARGCPRHADYPAPRRIGKGDELGIFHLGSTVIVLFARGRVEILPFQPGERVLLGQPLARAIAGTAGDRAA